MLKRIKCKSREEWLHKRMETGIGASSAAVVLGLMPFGKSRTQLWREITNNEMPKDISGNPAVARGNALEPILRDMFKAMHPEYKVCYHQYDILYQDDVPWLFATLDGELIDKDGRKGILEIKTAEPNSKAKWSEWNNGIPQNYYAQTLHQFKATGFDFVVVYAALFHAADGTITIVERMVERSDNEDSIAELYEVEKKFWDCCLSGKIPPTLIGGI